LTSHDKDVHGGMVFELVGMEKNAESAINLITDEETLITASNPDLQSSFVLFHYGPTYALEH
jgi:hypothetical protein